MGKALIDTNILIYQSKGILSDKQISKFIEDVFFISFISKIEFLGFKGLEPEEEREFTDIINDMNIIKINDAIIEKTIEIRRDNNIKTPDAIIAATAIINDMNLVSNNDKDFSQIDNLRYYNSMI